MIGGGGGLQQLSEELYVSTDSRCEANYSKNDNEMIENEIPELMLKPPSQFLSELKHTKKFKKTPTLD